MFENLTGPGRDGLAVSARQKEILESVKPYKSLEGYNTLSARQKEILETVQPIHYLAWGTKERKDFTLDQVKSVKPGESDDIVECYYLTDWYHYDSKGDWY